MRASRLLQILLILQNRGRQTAARLAAEIEVAPRTILRDVDAMTEAGLPIIVHQGNQGGIELGFNYRTRLTGLDADEAEALALHLAAPSPAVAQLGRADALATASAKLIESFPDKTRARIETAQERFAHAPTPIDPDPYVVAIAEAVRDARVVVLQASTASPQRTHPTKLTLTPDGWEMESACHDQPFKRAEWGDLNISAHRFA